MKTRLLIALTTLASASLANAVAIGLEWAGNTANANAEWGSFPLTARFYIFNGSAQAAQRPTIQAIGLQINAWGDAACTIPATLSVHQVSASSPLAGWSVAPANKNTYLNGLQFAAIAGPNTTFPQGKTYALDIQLQVNYPAAAGNYFITINRAGSALIDDTGADYMTNDAIWFPTGFATTGRAKWGFGNWGGGKWQRYDSSTSSYIGQEANPLIMQSPPEPASIGLLAIGAAACLRRPRRRGAALRGA